VVRRSLGDLDHRERSGRERLPQVDDPVRPRARLRRSLALAVALDEDLDPLADLLAVARRGDRRLQETSRSNRSCTTSFGT